MKHDPLKKAMICAAALVLLGTGTVPGNAFFRNQKEASVPDSSNTQENLAPIAKDMELSTYRNVSVTGWFDAVDLEGEPLIFHLVSTSARGCVQLSEDGSGKFVYTPYENKTGRDTFRYVAEDASGHRSQEAAVTIRISKPDTKIRYRDMDGHPAHKAALRLAEEGIFVGSCRSGSYYFQPDTPVCRGEFLSLAMSVSELEPLQGITATGFYDDSSIPDWCRGYVSSALMAGAIQGCPNDRGLPVFNADDSITYGQAAVMLNRLLNISDVSAEVFSPVGTDHWASQAAANLSSAGVLPPEGCTPQALTSSLTRGEVAELLDGALDVMETRKNSSWFTL